MLLFSHWSKLVLMKDILVSEAPPETTAELTPGLDNFAVTPSMMAGTASRRTVNWRQAFRNLVSGCLILSMGIILVYHFSLFWIVGGVIIEEPNRIILFFETLMSLAIIAFGLDLLLRN